MQKPAKFAAFVTIIGLSLLLVVVLVVNKLSITLTSQVFQVNDTPIAVPRDAATVARGSHLVRAVLGCPDCHDRDLAGKTVMQSPYLGHISASNLTTPPLTTDQLVRAIRYGVRDDGHGLWLMPTAAYAALSDADLGAVIAYIKSLTPIQREQPHPRLGLWGRALVATGKLVMVQAGAPVPSQPPPEPAENAAYGAYLAQIARCKSCHGEDLRGGGDGPQAPGDLTRSGLGSWHPTDFYRAMRDGKMPDGRVLSAGMPWRNFAAMTDLELGALWAYLQSLP